MTRWRAARTMESATHRQAATALCGDRGSHGYYPRRIGEVVEIAHLPGERLKVVALDDSARVTLRHARCGVMRVGWRHVRRLEWL